MNTMLVQINMLRVDPALRCSLRVSIPGLGCAAASPWPPLASAPIGAGCGEICSKAELQKGLVTNTIMEA